MSEKKKPTDSYRTVPLGGPYRAVRWIEALRHAWVFVYDHGLQFAIAGCVALCLGLMARKQYVETVRAECFVACHPDGGQATGGSGCWCTPEGKKAYRGELPGGGE